MPVGDPWERFNFHVALQQFGPGARHDFGWYFEGESLAPVGSLDELTDWLLGCEYVHDHALFHEPDFWQHPRTFEQLRRGDCEDHALWAWRKLVELGYEADLVSGRCLPWKPGVKGHERGHVWVIFRRDGETLLFETAAKTKSRMIRPLGEASTEYRPEFGVDHTRRRFAFNGLLETFRDREFSSPRTSEPRSA